MTDPTTRLPRIDPRLRIEVIEGEAVLLDATNQRVHHLNEVATFILSRCTGDRTEREIVAAVVERYEVDEAVAAAEASELLDRLRDQEILVPARLNGGP